MILQRLNFEYTMQTEYFFSDKQNVMLHPAK